QRKKIIIMSLVSVLLIFGAVKIISNVRKSNYITDINQTLESIDLAMVDDDLKDVSRTSSNPVRNFLYEIDSYYIHRHSDMFYSSTSLYNDMSKWNSILGSTGTLFKQLILECGIPDASYTHCTFDEKDYSYRINDSDTSTVIDIYEKGNSYLTYYKLDYKPGEYVHIYEGVQGEIVNGTLYMYDMNDSIKRYKFSDGEINFYSDFNLDGHYDFRYYTSTKYSLFEHPVTTFSDSNSNVEFSYDRNPDTDALNRYTISFFNTNVRDTFVEMVYEDNRLTKLKFEREYVDGWDDFYVTRCEELQEALYTGICETKAIPTIKIDDYEDVSLNNLLSLDSFDGISFSEVSADDLEDAHQYFINHYDTVYIDHAFDPSNLNLSAFPIYDKIQFDETIVDLYNN
ncbi:MAG: hypothetical protein ACOC1L_07775, partial [Bacillota bacterium]